ncbi:glycosyltransferase [Thalassotalea euphylliae]|uniref:glycosyltransferase n=1 Tax=Thalassotalea euphylliae TaxID=1655234 RepID=UPI0036408B19
MVQLIELFQTFGYDVTFASPAQRTEHMMDLADLQVEMQDILLNCDSFDAFVQALNPDAVMYDRYMMEEQFGWRVAKHCPNAVRILDTEDLQSLRNARHQAYKKNGSIDTIDWHTDLAIREVAAIYRCDLTIMISPAEIDVLMQHYGVPAQLLSYLPFVYPDDLLQAQGRSFDNRQHFISIGNFRHAPNWDSVLWLKQLWPHIRKQLPQAELHVYGAYPPKKATDLHCERSGFLVKGWVDNALNVMEQAKVCLAPLRFGAGIKGKLADAMLCGTPSVTTSIGEEGMASDQPWAGAVVNGEDEFIREAVALYQNASRWQEASKQAKYNRQFLFSSDKFVSHFQRQLDEIADQFTSHRQQNFVGLMLNHHSHRSTQFMSQWIAAKNKLAEANDV